PGATRGSAPISWSASVAALLGPALPWPGNVERGLLADRYAGVVAIRDAKIYRVRARFADIRPDPDADGDEAVAGGAHLHLGAGVDEHGVEAAHRQDVAAVLLRGVHDLQPVDVLDHAVLDLPRQRAPVADHVQLDGAARDHVPDERDRHRQQDGGVDEDARPQHATPELPASPALLHPVLGVVADEARRVVHLGHHRVTGVDARGAADAFDLQPVADFDPGRARLDAQPAVDARAQAQHGGVRLARARAAGLAAAGVVGDDQRVPVEHDALEACVRTHVLAHLLAHEAGVAVGGKAVEQDPERLPRPERGRGHQAREFLD